MPRQLRVMTYNVHSCTGIDGRTSTERIADVAARSGADIIALQEVDAGLDRTGKSDQAQEIAASLNMHFHFHPSHYREEGAFGNALLSRFPLRLIRTGALPTPRGLRRFEKRGALWAEVLLPEGAVQVVTTHFGLVRTERILQVVMLLGSEWLGHADCSPPVIFCGDLNALPRSGVYRRIAGRFRDVQRSLSGWSPRRTWPSRYPVARIDHIFVSPDLGVEEVTVMRDRLTRKASDHLPLLAALRLPERPGKEPGT